MTKKNKKRSQRRGSIYAVKIKAAMQVSAQAFNQATPQSTMTGVVQAFNQATGQSTMAGAAQAFNQAKGQSTMAGAAQAFNQASGQSTMAGAAQAFNQATGQSTMAGAAQTSEQGASQHTVQGVAQATVQVAAQVSGNASNPSNTSQGTSGTTKTYTKQQKKKWEKFRLKFLNKEAGKVGGILNTEPEGDGKPTLPEMNQGGPPNVTGQASEASTSTSNQTVTTGDTKQGATIPILENRTSKPTARAKAGSFFKKAAPPQLTPSPQVPPAEPYSGPPNVTGQASEAPTAVSDQTVSTGNVNQGATIPILENRTSKPTARVKAGSFFKKAAPPQPTPSPQLPPVEPYIYIYPKGIPRSFLKQQEKLLEPTGSPITHDSPIWPSNPNMNTSPIFAQPPTPNVGDNVTNPAISPILDQTECPVNIEQPYSPSDVYLEQGTNPESPDLQSECSEQSQTGQKRLSAFHRLGPLSQPKKPKLTINLNLNKEQPVREVVTEKDDDPDKYTPVHLRKDIITSTDKMVVKYLPVWPWKKNVIILRTATARSSRSVMILEQEKMEETYEKDHAYIQITVKGYPSTWTKERVLDAVLESVRGYSFIPSFIEFSQHECKFLVLRCRSALVVLHKTGFYIHKDGVELAITISIPALQDQLHFIPRIAVRKRTVMGYKDKKLDLSGFTLQKDVSHFVYFPLNLVSNQRECVAQTAVDWKQLVELNLSHNRLTTISGFDLVNVTPKLKHLDLSYNCLEKITVLLNDRLLPLKTLRLEGNPLCHDYIDPEHYVKVIRMMFPAIAEIDGVPIHRKGELPHHKPNYCPEEAHEVVEKFLEIYFPLFDSGPQKRSLIQGMYEDDATLTITYCYKLRYGQIYRTYRNLFLYARFLDEGEIDSVVGAMAITKLMNRWPQTEHDPSTFTVDVLYHTENTTVLRISGVLKLTVETLAEDEHLLSFTRTVVLHSEDGTEYKIQNEMVYWHEPSAEAASTAFRVNTISRKNFNLKIESTTDEDLRDKFLKIFMKLTTMDKKTSERCLEIKNWNFKLALEHFTKLLKLNQLELLTKEVDAAS